MPPPLPPALLPLLLPPELLPLLDPLPLLLPLPLPELFPLPEPLPEPLPPLVASLSEFETRENVEAVLLPKLRMPAIDTARIRLSITAYSTAVGPSSWRRKS